MPNTTHHLEDEEKKEEQRLEALRSLKILDTPPERLYDEIVELAAEFCDAPTALISLLDRDRQWFKARVGMEAPSTPRAVAFCDHAIRQGTLLEVHDATQDPRFCNNPLVIDSPGIRFYAGQPIRSASGHALGTLCVLDYEPRELTPRQASTLRKLSRQLETLLHLREAGVQLAQQNKQLQEKNRELSRMRENQERLARHLIHDFKSPLGTIYTTAVMLKEDIDPEGDPFLEQALTSLPQTTNRLMRLVGNMLQLSRTGQLTVQRKGFELVEVVQGLIDARSFWSRHYGLKLIWDKPTWKRPLVSDQALVERILENLLDNAFKYARRGGVIKIRMSYAPKSNSTLIHIEDRGQGIPCAMRASIFQDGFSSNHRVVSDSQGIGLAFSREAAQALGGDLTYKPAQPYGCHFTLRLPHNAQAVNPG